MRYAYLLFAFALVALITTTHAQSTATVLIQDSTYYGSANAYMSTSFVGLKLPSGGGNVYITFTPGDWADSSYVVSMADHTQTSAFQISGNSYTLSIGSTGHYWIYLATSGTTSNVDWLEIRVEASTYSGTVTCSYCSPPSGWTSGWPPAGVPQELGHVQSQPGFTPKNVMVPRWVIPVLAVVVAVALLVPISYCVYRRHQNKKSMPSTPESSIVEMQTTSAV